MDELNSKLIFRGRLSVFAALNATLPHWNEEIVGDWERLRRIKNFGSAAAFSAGGVAASATAPAGRTSFRTYAKMLSVPPKETRTT
jgi:hypothetical protein